METWERGGSFRDRLAVHPVVAARVRAADLDRWFDPAHYLRHLGRIYERTLATAWEA
jgi:adenylosuccinate lyase